MGRALALLLLLAGCAPQVRETTLLALSDADAEAVKGEAAIEVVSIEDTAETRALVAAARRLVEERGYARGRGATLLVDGQLASEGRQLAGRASLRLAGNERPSLSRVFLAEVRDGDLAGAARAGLDAALEGLPRR